jgi:hypothetical protein
MFPFGGSHRSESNEAKDDIGAVGLMVAMDRNEFRNVPTMVANQM